VADTRLIPRSDRLVHLQALRRAFQGDVADVAAVARACRPHHQHASERALLDHLGTALDEVNRLAAADRADVRGVLGTITSGMIFDLERFPGEDAATLTALETPEDLDRYTYLVAGCVGEFWTTVHVRHRPRLWAWNPAEMAARGVRFGKALQMTNVLRDVPSDLRAGRCYLPARELDALGLGPADLLEPSKSARARPLLTRLIERTLQHYDVAWSYTLAIPRLEWRMRLACAWPLLIGLGTLAAIARVPDMLAHPGPIKISRSAIRAIVTQSTLTAFSNHALRREAQRRRAEVVRALQRSPSA
jgi:farnesyl-diphosphate farnesyltransferase